MLLQKIFHLILEIHKQLWIFFNISLPFRTFKILAYSDDILEKLLTKLFCYFFHQPCRNIVHFGIDVHTNINNSNIFFNRSISHNKIFVIKLNVIGMNIDWELKLILKLFSVMNRSCKKKQFFVGMIEPAITDSLEEGFSSCKERNMVQSVTNSTVSCHLFFLSRNF